MNKKELEQVLYQVKKGIIEENLLVQALESSIENFRTKRFGLVWEQKSEQIVETLKSQDVYLKNEESLNIIKDENLPMNMLIEGDNYASLLALKNSGKKVNIIYIDPPYNTGSENFIYQDKYRDVEDAYRHSEWLSFMDRRLRLAKDLLTDDGVIFVSIDDNEQANLKLLMDEVFGEINFISQIIWEKGGGKSDSKYLANKKEYILVYGKKDTPPFTQQDSPSENYKYEDSNGRYSLQGFGRRGLTYTKTLDYPIEAPDGTYIYPGNSKEMWEKRQNGEHNNRDWRWTLSKREFNRRLEKDEIVFIKRKDGYRVYYKSYLEGKTYPYSDLILTIGNNKSSREIVDLFGSKVFEYSKPVDLIKHLVNLHPNKQATVLDFFAGSGTTGQAVMELNKEDGGKRQFILCTNNENNICREITYIRNKKVIEGYKEKEGINSNLLFYTQEFRNRGEDLDIHLDLIESFKEYVKIHSNSNIVKYSSPNMDFYTGEKDVLFIKEPWISEPDFRESLSNRDKSKELLIYTFYILQEDVLLEEHPNTYVNMNNLFTDISITR